MNVLVTGANGQLGSELRRLSEGEPHRFIFTDVAELDITSADAVSRMVRDEGADVIVNCAAYTDVEAAEDNPEKAELLNSVAVRNLADAMKACGGLLVHISTDYVFGAEAYNTPCTEDMTGTPTGIYGLTKLHGERQIAESGCRSIIIRTSWLYSAYGRNFVKTILRLSAECRELKVVFDQVGTPTYARDLAAAVLHILDKPVEGIFNYSNEGVCSWYDFARAIVALSGHDSDIQPCHSSEFPSKVKRPPYSVLDKTKIKDTFGVRVPYWMDSLAECISILKGE